MRSPPLLGGDVEQSDGPEAQLDDHEYDRDALVGKHLEKMQSCAIFIGALVEGFPCSDFILGEK